VSDTTKFKAGQDSPQGISFAVFHYRFRDNFEEERISASIYETIFSCFDRSLLRRTSPLCER
jgi:hypothetical protein